MPLYPDFKRLYQPAAPSDQPVKWLPIRGRDLVVQQAGEGYAPLTDLRDRFAPEEPLVLGELHGVTYLAFDGPADLELPENWRTIDLWRLHGRIDEQDWVVAGYAAHILHWRRTSAYCPVCGHTLGPMGQEWMRECPQCGHQRYP